ncbi:MULTISPECIES: transposase [unclassified Frankia]|uniref:transposase n=1 Tax=unclassified Frankia TaxID=2632575 RepID=UPI001EF6C946|nr:MULTISPECIES: transposase [unclassified Frankia]
MITLVLLDQSTQARAAQGYDTASFSFDVDQRRGTCPEGRTSASWIPCRQRDTDAIVVTGARTICGPCPKRELCTKGRQRQITIRDRDLNEALAAARAEQTTDEWKRRYATRAGVEGTMRQSTHTAAGRPTLRPAQRSPWRRSSRQPPSRRPLGSRHGDRSAR